jgi:hypothetical protein
MRFTPAYFLSKWGVLTRLAFKEKTNSVLPEIRKEGGIGKAGSFRGINKETIYQ